MATLKPYDAWEDRPNGSTITAEEGRIPRAQNKPLLPKINRPSERYECQRFVSWLISQKIKHTHIANETSTMRQGLRNKRMGVSPGVPDYMILLPGLIVFVEMKRQKPSYTKLSKEQKSWLEDLQLSGAAAKVCYGFEEAKEFVSAIIEERTHGSPSQD